MKSEFLMLFLKMRRWLALVLEVSARCNLGTRTRPGWLMAKVGESRRRGSFWQSACLATAALWTVSVFGLILSPLSIESLSTEADVVVQGTVLSKTCLRDAQGRIYTRVELAVSEIWKGGIGGSPLLIFHGGGVLGEQQSTVLGQVDYQPGEEVVAFLVRNDRRQAVTLGLMQGKFHVWKDAKTGLKLVANPFHGVPENMAASLAPRNASQQISRSSSLTLAELRRRVEEAAR